MNKQALKNGTIFEFNNFIFCEQNFCLDDLRSGHIQFNKQFGYYFIIFNGQCIYSSKSFTSMKKRLNTLFFKWNCTFL
jgi:hypothetical protein